MRFFSWLLLWMALKIVLTSFNFTGFFRLVSSPYLLDLAAVVEHPHCTCLNFSEFNYFI